MPQSKELELALDDAVYIVTVRGKASSYTATVVTEINSFDRAGELGCKAIALENGWSEDELWPWQITMLTDPLIIDQ